MSTPAIVTASARVRPGQEKAFDQWQVRFDQTISRFPGYLSREALPPGQSGGNEWKIILHFQSPEAVIRWHESKERGHLIDEVLSLLVAGKLEEEVSTPGAGKSDDGTVTQLILCKIRPGMEDSYREWSVRIQQMQAKYPGYRGMYLQPPEPGSGGHWTTMLRYDTHEHLEGWLNCPERKEMLQESHAFIEDLELMRLATSFPGWVPVNPSTGQGPPNWKAALLVLLGLYPIVMFETHFTLPLFDSLGISHPLATFACNLATVMITGYVTMPLFVRWFRWWLFVNENSPPYTTAKGPGILIALYLAEIAFCWLLLP